jgi:hypothetical protein
MQSYQVDNLVQWLGTLLVLGFLTLLAYRRARRMEDQRHELRMKVLERFSSQEFVALLETEGGRKWMADVLTGRSEPEDVTGEALRRAVVLTFVGLGLVAAGAAVHSKLLGIAGVLTVLGAAGLWVGTWVVARRRERDAVR